MLQWKDLTRESQMLILEYLGYEFILQTQDYEHTSEVPNLKEAIDQYHKVHENKVEILDIKDGRYTFGYISLLKRRRRRDMRQAKIETPIFMRCVKCKDTIRTYFPHSEVTSVYSPMSAYNICFFCKKSNSWHAYELNALYVGKEDVEIRCKGWRFPVESGDYQLGLKRLAEYRARMQRKIDTCNDPKLAYLMMYDRMGND